MMHDSLGDTLKAIEAVETERRLDRAFPVYARLDGRGFSKFTRDMMRPYDPRLSWAMVDTTRVLVSRTQARIGYTQSDEISLLWWLSGENEAEELMFGGKIQKLVSVLAGIATAALTHAVATHEDESFRGYSARLPHFDARVMNLPDRKTAVDMFRWREQDARRNAVGMVAHHTFGPQPMIGVKTRDRARMLEEAGIKMELYPAAFRRGTYVQRRVYERRLSDAEWLAIPEKSRPEHDRLFQRGTIEEISMPPLHLVDNAESVLFDREDPVVTAPRLQACVTDQEESSRRPA